MTRRSLSLAAVLALSAAAPAAHAATAPRADPQSAGARYALVGGCYALRSTAAGRFVAKTGDGGWRASAADAAGGEPLRMQATALGHYLFYAKAGDFLAQGSGDKVQTDATPAEPGNWTVDVAGAAFKVTSSSGRALAAAADGALTLADPAAGDAAAFTFQPAQGCADFPEVATSTTGEPSRGKTPYSEVAGFLDAHIHGMAFEFLGGRAHCGRPWSPFGVTVALVDCPDHYPNGGGAVLENTISRGNPAGTHDPVGWPTFKDWPNHASLTHEQTYYKWLERAWRGGLRTWVNLFVENHALCLAYPLKKNSCNEMDSVRLQAKDIRQLQDYIDAQSGGPGKGWFRIVENPFEARRVINQGKLAVILGIEVSQLFDCNVQDDVPTCTKDQIDQRLDEVYKLGVRDMELVNKFDNALGGVAGDGGPVGAAVNGANKVETGKFWQLQTCTGPAEESDHEQMTLPGAARDSLLGNGLQALLPSGEAPVYPAPPHCNTRGLTTLGEHLVRRMMERGMVIDPDHLDVLARKQLLSVVESKRYSGVVSSHSWSTSDAFPRIYKLGGVVTPYAGASTSFVSAWKKVKPMHDDRFYFGFGYGADMNGFGSQGGPRGGANPVKYPFKSFDGAVTLDRQHSGSRVFDINTDGVAHYGLFPDWIEDLRMIAGDQIVKDMSRGPEAYLQMWERAVGITPERCRERRLRFTSQGLGLLRVGVPAEELLRGSDQPAHRIGRVWSYCVDGRPKTRGRVRAVFTPHGTVGLLVSTAPRHRALGIGRGTRVSRLQGLARPFGPNLLVRDAGKGRRLVYGVGGDRVRFAALASPAAAKTPARLRGYLRMAGLH